MEDYRNWKARQQILRLITVRNMDGAKQALKCYQQEHDMGDKLERQFYLSMQVQLDRMEGAADGALREKFQEAVLLTVPEVEEKSIKEMLLSVQELNLMLEYERYQSPDNLEQRYREMLEYIESSNLDTLSRAKIYPKVVFYLYRCLEQREERLADKISNQILVLCNKAVRMLQECTRMHYLCEILHIRRDMLQRIMDGLSARGEAGKASALESMKRETEEWIGMFESLYEEYHIPKEMYEYCYLYVEKEVYCISDVIRTRRKMLGMTQKELADNICSEKTLTRLENSGAKTQREIVEALFARLNLSAEYCKTDLVTENHEAVLLMKKLVHYSEEKDYEKIEEVVKRLEELVSMDIPSNKQVIERCRVMNEWFKGSISSAEYLQKMKGVLEITLPQKIIFYTGEKYMTRMERICVQNFSVVEDDMNQKYFEVLCEPYEYYEKENLLGSFIGMYEITMDRLGSYLGNMGEYEKSDAVNKKLILECLLNKRASMLDGCIYGIFWNNQQRQKEGIPFQDQGNISEYLYYCILLSRFCKLKHGEAFYKRKMETLKEK